MSEEEDGRAGEAADTELKTKTPHVNVGKNCVSLSALSFLSCPMLANNVSNTRFQQYPASSHRHSECRRSLVSWSVQLPLGLPTIFQQRPLLLGPGSLRSTWINLEKPPSGGSEMFIPMIHVKMIQVISSDCGDQTWNAPNVGKKKLWRLLCTTGRTEKNMFGSPPAASLDEPRIPIPGPALIFRCQKMCSVFLWAAQGCQSQKSPKAWAVFEPSRNDSFIIGPLCSKEWFFNPRSSYGSKSNRHFTQKSDLFFEPFWPGSTNLI